MKPCNQVTYQFSPWVKNAQTTIMQKMLEASALPNMISFALGLPDPEIFPVMECQESIRQILMNDSKSLQYSPPISSLKSHIVKLMASRGVICNESQVFLTSGAQQGVYLLSKLFLKQDTNIIAEKLTYPGFYQIVTPFMPNIISVKNDHLNGICLASLERILKCHESKPAFIYVIPEGHNPLGISLDNTKKQALALLSRRYQVPIIEDDAYGFLHYETLNPPIRAYDDKWVFYVGTFSKIIAPALRTGWIIIPEELVSKLAFAKEASDINTTTFGYRIISNYLTRYDFNEHLAKLCVIYKQKRDLMVSAIKKYFPQEISISDVKHGFFVWVELPPYLSSMKIFNQAIKENIAFMPGEVFSNDPSTVLRNGLRLNFSHPKPSIIELGIKKLGNIIKKELISYHKYYPTTTNEMLVSKGVNL